MKSALKKLIWVSKVASRPQTAFKAIRLQGIFIAVILGLFLFVTPVFAQSAWNAWHQSQFSLKTVMYGASCELVGCGIEEQKPQQNADGSWSTPKISFNSTPRLGGVIGFSTNTMIAMYNNPPTSSTYYLANLGKEFGIVSPAYAQVAGSGAGLIKPVEQLWQILRNVSYLFFVIIFVVIGFMIMLRQKMNPQTVITAQAALPSLIIGLILVTFSYFLSALMTDLAFVGVQIVAQVFVSIIDDKTKTVMNVFDPVNLANNSSIFDIYKSSWGAAWSTLGANPNAYGETIRTAGSIVTSDAFSSVIGLTVAGALLAFLGSLPVAGLVAGGTALAVVALPLIVTLILLIAFTVQFLKLTFKLLMSYIMILISTALAPIYITFSLLPGRGGFLAMWWKNVLGNALVFPAVFAVFLFAGMILRTDPSAWESTPPFFANISTQLLQPLIAFVIILGTPAIPDMVKKAVGATDMGEVGKTGIAGFMGGYAMGGKAVNKGIERGFSPWVNERKAYQDLQIKARMGDRAARAQIDRIDRVYRIAEARGRGAPMWSPNRWLPRIKGNYVRKRI